jgi:hypothetical protein
MIIAGIEAIAHLTINHTIDKNGILMSVTSTFETSESIIHPCLNQHKI